MGMVKIKNIANREFREESKENTQHCLGKIGGIAFPTLASPHTCAKQPEGLGLGNSWQQM